MTELSSDLNFRIQQYIISGGFRNTDEVLDAALDALEVQEREKRRRWDEGNRIAAEQSRQGLSQPLDDNAVLTRLRQRLANEGITD